MFIGVVLLININTIILYITTIISTVSTRILAECKMKKMKFWESAYMHITITIKITILILI